MTHSHEVHFFGKIAQKAIIFRDDKILLIRDPRESEEIWEIPGGRMNENEDPRAGLEREIFEELGVNCVVHEVIHMEQFFQFSDGRNAFVIVYSASLVDQNAKFTFDDGEVCEYRWVGEDEYTNLKLFPEYKRALEIYYLNKK